MRNKQRSLLITLLTLCVSSCGTAPLYVEADRATYQAIAPEYSRYVQMDKKLSQSQKTLRLDTVASWLRRIEAVPKR